MNIQAAKKYLSLGMRPSQIASILGVSPGRISQLALEYKDEIETLSQIVSSEDVCDGKIETATWGSRWKTYKSDWMDEDMKNSTVSHYVDRIIINDAQLASKSSVDDMIEFLTNARESFKF